MNTTQIVHQTNLSKWADIIRDQQSSSLTDDSCNIRTRFLNYPDTRSSIIRTSILETYGQLFLKYADSYS